MYLTIVFFIDSYRLLREKITYPEIVGKIKLSDLHVTDGAKNSRRPFLDIFCPWYIIVK